MRVFIYNGGLRLVGKSGVGQAILHQREMLRRARIDTADHWCQRAGAVHINTVLPDSVLAALAAKLMGRKVIYYGHSTMEDFRRSFRGSDRLAPLFRKWITFCYSLGDVVLTPTEYSRRLLESYGLKPPVYSISNGVDTEFFAPDPTRRASFRRRWGLREGERAVISVGHTIARKGLPEFLELARADAGGPFPLVRLDGSPSDPPGDPAGHGTGAGECDLRRLCRPGDAAGGILRRGCIRLHES